MKMFMTLLSMMLVVGATANAQGKGTLEEVSSQGGLDSVRFGFQAGFDLMDVGLDPEPAEDPSTRTGVIGGVNIEVPVNRNFAIQPELMYVQKGAETETPDATLALDYIELPILLKGRFPTGKFMPFVFAGPYVGLNVNAQRDDTDVGDAYDAWDFGVDFGAGAELAVSQGVGVFLSGRYALGLTDVRSGEFALEGADIEVKNRGFQFLGGVQLGI